MSGFGFLRALALGVLASTQPQNSVWRPALHGSLVALPKPSDGRTGVAAMKRVAKKRRNRKRSRK